MDGDTTQMRQDVEFLLVDGGVHETRTRKAAAQRGSDERRERAAKREKFDTLKDASNPIDQRPSAVRPALAGLNDAPANAVSIPVDSSASITASIRDSECGFHR